MIRNVPLLVAVLALAFGLEAAGAEMETLVRVHGFLTQSNTQTDFFVPASRLQAPTNCWAPALERCPFGIRDLVSKARRHVEMTMHPKAPLELFDMSWRALLEFMPTDTIHDPSKPVPWVVVFIFGYKDDNGLMKSFPDEGYVAVLLPDGTIAIPKQGRTKTQKGGHRL